MNSKLLSIRSFERNQTLLSQINRLIINLKLNAHNIKDSEVIREQEIQEAKALLKRFFASIEKGLEELESDTKILTGVDLRQRSFIRKFNEAKKRPQQYKSILFKKSPSEIIELLETDSYNTELVMVLSDLRKLINEHMALDLKDLVGNI